MDESEAGPGWLAVVVLRACRPPCSSAWRLGSRSRSGAPSRSAGETPTRPPRPVPGEQHHTTNPGTHQSGNNQKLP